MTDEEKFRATEQAAKQGDPEVQYQLGWMYDMGEGTEKDKDMAIYWYKKAADQGHPKAQYKYAYFLDTSYDKIISWYEKAGEQGHPQAQNQCAIMYRLGEGTAKDEDKERYWYEKAAAQTEDMEVREDAEFSLTVTSFTDEDWEKIRNEVHPIK